MIDPEEALPRPVSTARPVRPVRPVPPVRPAPQPGRALAWARGPLTLGALCYALLAAACAAAVIASGASWRLVAPTAGLCALAACVAEWMASRRAALPARDLALAVYIAGALLLPAPWAVLVVVVATLVSLPARRGLSTVALLATTAHTVLVVTVFTVASHVALGDGQVWRDSAVFAGNPAALPRALSSGATMPALAAAGRPWYGAAFYTPRTLVVLLLLCGAYYLLETVPPALLCAVARRRRPLRVWSDLYGHAVPLQLVALPLAPTLVALDTAAPALALLALPLPIGAAWIAVALHRARMVADEAGVLRENTAALYARAAAAEEHARRGDASAEALLAAIRGIGGNDDLVEVTATLARAATRLTHFRACVVYLYESRDGVFVACADQLQGARRGEVVSRARVEALMSPRRLLGYSYYAPRSGHDNAETEQGAAGGGAALGPWQDGAALLTPLLLKNGDVIGYIGLDRPSDRRVPSAAELTPLETLAFLAASVIARLRHTDEVLHLAASDGLTGLLNRRAFEEHLQRERVDQSRGRRPLRVQAHGQELRVGEIITYPPVPVPFRPVARGWRVGRAVPRDPW